MKLTSKIKFKIARRWCTLFWVTQMVGAPPFYRAHTIIFFLCIFIGIFMTLIPPFKREVQITMLNPLVIVKLKLYSNLFCLCSSIKFKLKCLNALCYSHIIASLIKWACTWFQINSIVYSYFYKRNRDFRLQYMTQRLKEYLLTACWFANVDCGCITTKHVFKEIKTDKNRNFY